MDVKVAIQRAKSTY